MKNIIIGTAGHVDHGKTALIKALSGINADRLKEEQKRGITIDLGFAFMDLPDGERAGIIDVPGHEKFIKNMLAGAGGIDLALLVIAADDGVMPQTREHLGILNLLDVHDGIIVLTKADLVDEEWLEMIREDVKDCVKGTFLEAAPIFTVSAYTGQGIETLRQGIIKKLTTTDSKNTALPFRIPVDRVFSVDGFGTVITGTLIEGCLSAGDELMIYPEGTPARVRNLQVHSKDVQTAYAGQRVAVNLSGIKREEVERGNTLAAPDSMNGSLRLDIRLSILPESLRTIRNRSRLHFYHGADDRLCKLVLLEQEQLGPGEQGYAQLIFTEPVALKKGDHFVVRFYSPLETVGGGIVLDPNPIRHRRNSDIVIESLKVREHGSPKENLLQAIADGSRTFTPLSSIQQQLKLDNDSFQDTLNILEEEGQVIRLTDKVAVDAGYYLAQGRELVKMLQSYHEQNSLQAGIRRKELLSQLFPRLESAIADKLLTRYETEGLVRSRQQILALPDFKIHYSPAEQLLADEITKRFQANPYAPPSLDALMEMDKSRQKDVKRIVDAMLAGGELTLTGPQMLFLTDTVLEAREKVSGWIRENGQITLGEMRDLSGTSRKFALSLLEYFDRNGITKKLGDARVLGAK